jgi:hypothetical protein
MLNFYKKKLYNFMQFIHKYENFTSNKNMRYAKKQKPRSTFLNSPLFIRIKCKFRFFTHSAKKKAIKIQFFFKFSQILKQNSNNLD